jgi:hypothetical protein
MGVGQRQAICRATPLQGCCREFAVCTAGVFEGERARAFVDGAAALERTSDLGRIVQLIRL